MKMDLTSQGIAMRWLRRTRTNPVKKSYGIRLVQSIDFPSIHYPAHYLHCSNCRLWTKVRCHCYSWLTCIRIPYRFPQAAKLAPGGPSGVPQAKLNRERIEERQARSSMRPFSLRLATTKQCSPVPKH
jgi:hypothetical protein